MEFSTIWILPIAYLWFSSSRTCKLIVGIRGLITSRFNVSGMTISSMTISIEFLISVIAVSFQKKVYLVLFSNLLGLLKMNLLILTHIFNALFYSFKHSKHLFKMLCPIIPMSAISVGLGLLDLAHIPCFLVSSHSSEMCLKKLCEVCLESTSTQIQ